jgi:hypothetical protein
MAGSLDPPVGRWVSSFNINRLWDDGKFSKGSLVLSRSKWLVLLNESEDPLVGRALENGEVIHDGSLVRFPSHMSMVVSSIESPWPAKEPPVLHWKVQCSPFVNGDWSSWRSGFLILRPLAQRLVLLNNEEILIDARFLLENESISKGNQIELPVHKVIIGDQISPSSDQNSKIIDTCVAEDPLKSSAQELQVSPPQFNFARGTQFAEDIFKNLGHSVNFSPGFRKRPFFLVVAFGHSNFKLDVHTVSVSLQACFGGEASHFQVSLLRGRVFKFVIASRSVGFEIYNSGSFFEKDFVLHFLLWGRGGPNWEFKERKYYLE